MEIEMHSLHEDCKRWEMIQVWIIWFINHIQEELQFDDNINAGKVGNGNTVRMLHLSFLINRSLPCHVYAKELCVKNALRKGSGKISDCDDNIINTQTSPIEDNFESLNGIIDIDDALERANQFFSEVC